MSTLKRMSFFDKRMVVQEVIDIANEYGYDYVGLLKEFNKKFPLNGSSKTTRNEKRRSN